MNVDQKKFAYLIAYVDKDHIDKVYAELRKYDEFAEVTPLIPTVKIVKKTKKNKQHFEEIPLLFNYGFFRVPRKYAIHPKFLESLQQSISCIFAWVKDPVKKHRTVSDEQDERDDLDDNYIPTATATAQEVSQLIRDSNDYSAHSSDDLEKLQPGEYIVLKGYPFENMEAEFVSVNPAKRTAQVKISMFGQMKEIRVQYDNIFFTTYHNKGYDDTLSVVASLDAMSQTGAADKAQFKNYKAE